MTPTPEEKKRYTEAEMHQAVEGAIQFERQKHATILNYLLNLHSHPLPRGLDYEKAYEAIEDYEHYLLEML